MGFPRLVLPVRGRVTSGYGPRWGRMHRAVDIAAPIGTPVLASMAGQVVWAGWAGALGIAVVVQEGPWAVVLGHLSSHSVRRGDRVGAQTVVGRVGATGRATGPHVHWAAYDGRGYLDPLTLVG